MKTPMIVAEIGAAHNGSLQRVLDTVQAAAAAGADAIKLQTFTADTMVLDRTAVVASGPWAGRNLYELYREAAMPWEWQPRIFALAQDCGMLAFSTPFDETAVDFLESIECPMYKVASFEINDIALIRKIASTGKPIIISTGMADMWEIQAAIAAAKGCSKVTILKCTSAYPAPVEEMNLSNIQYLSAAFGGVDIGLSDHTDGWVAAVTAAAMGATVIEKHITLNRAGGPDDSFAALPHDFADMVKWVRQVVSARGVPVIGASASELSSTQFRRGLYAVVDLSPGDVVSPDNVKARRPRAEIGANEIASVMGHAVLVRPVKAGAPLAWADVSRET